MAGDVNESADVAATLLKSIAVSIPLRQTSILFLLFLFFTKGLAGILACAPRPAPPVKIGAPLPTLLSALGGSGSLPMPVSPRLTRSSQTLRALWSQA